MKSDLSILSRQRSSFMLVLFMSGCSIFGTGSVDRIPPALELVRSDAVLDSVAVENAAPTQTQVFSTPKPPSGRSANVRPPASPEKNNIEEKADISLVFDQLPLTSFIQVVYGNILKKNFSVDPKVAERRDLVTLRTSSPQTPSQVLQTTQMLLKSYGVAVTDVGGFYRIVPDGANAGYAPEIRRGRSLPSIPVALRPIYQLVELSAVRQIDVIGWIKQIYGSKITVQEDPARNALMLSGQSDDVNAAMEAIQVLDQPSMRGRFSQRITPAYWSVEELGKKLTDVLNAEGYSVGPSAPILLLQVPAINSIIVFANSNEVLDHINQWVGELDEAANRAQAKGKDGLFTYQVKHLDASALAKTIQDILSVADAKGAKQTKVVVNSNTNTLIFQGSAETYTQMMGVLRELDRPSRTALIEVTVAEVKMTDSLKLGLEWAYNRDTKIEGDRGAVNISGAGLISAFINNASNFKVALNALASNNQAQILSSPRIMARNGEEATIQVGSEVPIVTSQQTTNQNTTTSNQIMQTIQYRSTGVILNVKPVIHSSGQIDLDVSQEVSNAVETVTGVTTSPTINSRKVKTKLSLKDGATILLGGLMSSSRSSGDSGVPGLKDIPYLGKLFGTSQGADDRTELIVLITPYIINDEHEAEAITAAFRRQLGGWAAEVPRPKYILDESHSKRAIEIKKAQLRVNEKKPAGSERTPTVTADPGAVRRSKNDSPSAPQVDYDKPDSETQGRFISPSNSTNAPSSGASERLDVVPPPAGRAPKPVVSDEQLKKELMEFLDKKK